MDGRVRSPAAVFWLAAGFFALLVQSLAPTSRTAQVMLALLCMLLGGAGFWAGGSRISARNVYSYGFGLFVGFAGLYTIIREPVPSLLPALTVCYFGQVLIHYLTGDRRREPVSLPPDAARRALLVGAAMFGVTFAARVTVGENALLDQAVFAGGLLLVIGLFHGGWRGWRMVLSLTVLLLAAGFVFNGFGRLQLGVFGIAAAMVADRRGVKTVLLIVTGPALLYFAHQRETFGAALHPGTPVTPGAGIASVVSPLQAFTQLLSLSERHALGLHYLETFFASAVFWVPRHVWSGKPVGFGLTLSDLLAPQLRGTTNSLAALLQGEWLYAFGPAGLVLMVPAVVVFLRWVDTRRVGGLMGLLAWVTFTAGLPDLVWGGTFTYVSRAGERVAIAAVVLLAVPRLAGSRVRQIAHASS